MTINWGRSLNYDPTSTSNAMKETVKGQDAELTINGTTIKRSTNSVADALQGVTLDSENHHQTGRTAEPGGHRR